MIVELKEAAGRGDQPTPVLINTEFVVLVRPGTSLNGTTQITMSTGDKIVVRGTFNDIKDALTVPPAPSFD